MFGHVMDRHCEELRMREESMEDVLYKLERYDLNLFMYSEICILCKSVCVDVPFWEKVSIQFNSTCLVVAW